MLGRKCLMSRRTEGPTTLVHIVAACAHAVLCVSQCVSELSSLTIRKMPMLTDPGSSKARHGPPTSVTDLCTALVGTFRGKPCKRRGQPAQTRIMTLRSVPAVSLAQ